MFFSFGENSHPIKTPTPTHILQLFPNSVSLVNDVTKSMRPLPGPRQYIKKVLPSIW